MASLAAYRRVLGAARVAFMGDERMLVAARDQIRSKFLENRNLAPEAALPAIRLAEDVAKMLRNNIVQGEQTAADTYRLRIHEETERGDNESVKTAGSKGACACS